VRKRVLVLAHLFPPAGGGGVQRTLGFVRHLSELGWDPVVVAGEGEGYWAKDPSLLDGVQAPVVRVPLPPWDAIRRLGRRAMPGPLRRGFDRTFVPDARIAWARPAADAALRLHDAEPVDAIYSSGPPWSGHVAAGRFAGRTGVPWIADFRDPWTENPLQPPPAVLRPLHRRLEAWVHAHAALSVASTERYRRRMQQTFGLGPGKTLHLPNGYTESDFEDLPPSAPELRLGYAGSYYGAHSPTALFDAFERAMALDSRLEPRIELFGQTGDPGVRAFEVRAHGYVPHRRALEELARCRVVFVTVPEWPGADGCVPQKLYVYLRLGRPVLWFGPRGEATDILQRAKGTWFATSPTAPDLPGLARWLEARTRQPAHAAFDPEIVAEYDRRRLTERLAKHLDAVVSRTRSGTAFS